ncbi:MULTISPECIES: IclR family transcriptional regulator C-terminal domain-containing protein [unclassified Cupriavidus]|uniref:IclR family transcriptional regulator domain-containing protein n=1 Tax=unclassified Cupriavidus TaxID=2640874 RepID=UPI001AEA61DC|nr:MULTISPECIES: IclR family transcriptional regulator C-terminal domain-containing protein [unclassified Cupriavidus]MBP0629679.1 helix-turn-helix domain-containing protein [Cupriavidus sp. AcVe19-1a]MBP0636705.1 helix-turn-helix domain-containing protein [Cupriavidus sp. AcVe19-6a]
MWNPKVKTVTALDRGLAVLGAVQASGGASLQGLHELTGLPKATLLRILVTLERRNLIWRRIADGHYCPGTQPPARSRQAGVNDRLAQYAAPELDRLQAEILWPSDLAIRRGNAMVLCETNRAESYFMIRRDNIGFQVNMLRSAVGQAYLAFCTDKERESILAALRRSRRGGDAMAHDAERVAALIAGTRQRGYGVRDQGFGGDYDKGRTEANDRLEALAVPVMSARGRVYGCVNIVWIQGVRTLEQMVGQCLAPLQRTAASIAHRMSADG